ncbi:MAG: hypothetical protein OSA43_10800, partial [Pirellulales bacterium]|nr:hypothetical protein [Pirellulales bacterium]
CAYGPSPHAHRSTQHWPASVRALPAPPAAAWIRVRLPAWRTFRTPAEVRLRGVSGSANRNSTLSSFQDPLEHSRSDRHHSG